MVDRVGHSLDEAASRDKQLQQEEDNESLGLLSRVTGGPWRISTKHYSSSWGACVCRSSKRHALVAMLLLAAGVATLLFIFGNENSQQALDGGGGSQLYRAEVVLADKNVSTENISVKSSPDDDSLTEATMTDVFLLSSVGLDNASSSGGAGGALHIPAEIRAGLRRCNESTFTLEEGTVGTLANRIKRADCGVGYNFRASAARTNPWRVVLFGPGWSGEVLEYSGCPIGNGRCPWSPKCVIAHSLDPRSSEHADVVAVFQKESDFIVHAHRHEHSNASDAKPHRVLYWREALWPSANIHTQRTLFDFEMGVHHFSGILNPIFLRGPSDMINGIIGLHSFIPFENRTNFAMSVISDCNAPSYRQLYINRLVHSLGHQRIHQYGRCGSRHLPSKPIERAAQIISTYKFYLAFENTIMSGYVTEKLTSVLMMNVVPVYYGTPDAPNITKTPSYIRASDFKTPAALAEYLLYLDKNPDEYMKYHAWRTDPSQFDDEYLWTIENKVPGPYELQAHIKFPHIPRTTACCRLCDENFVKTARARRDAEKDVVVGTKWSFSKIDSFFFDGKLKG